MEKDKSYLSGFIKKMRADKKLERAVYIAVFACVALLLIVSGKLKDGAKDNVEIQSAVTTEADTEKRLAEALSQIRGAGKVQVMITYDSTSELVPAMSSSKQSSNTEANGSVSKNENESNQLATVNAGGEQEPIVLKEIQPKVRGVIVIAEGAADITVKLSLEHATSTVLGIDSSAIEVFEMKGTD